MTNLSLSEVYKIQREKRRQAPSPTTEVISKIVQDVRVFIPESIPTEQFLGLYGDKIDPETRKILELTKPRCRLHLAPPPEETIVGFELMPLEADQKYLTQRLERLERIGKLAKELPNPWAMRRARQKESKEG